MNFNLPMSSQSVTYVESTSSEPLNVLSLIYHGNFLDLTCIKYIYLYQNTFMNVMVSFTRFHKQFPKLKAMKTVEAGPVTSSFQIRQAAQEFFLLLEDA
jgi:hypothetical protein